MVLQLSAPRVCARRSVHGCGADVRGADGAGVSFAVLRGARSSQQERNSHVDQKKGKVV